MSSCQDTLCALEKAEPNFIRRSAFGVSHATMLCVGVAFPQASSTEVVRRSRRWPLLAAPRPLISARIDPRPCAGRLTGVAQGNQATRIWRRLLRRCVVRRAVMGRGATGRSVFGRGVFGRGVTAWPPAIRRETLGA